MFTTNIKMVQERSTFIAGEFKFQETANNKDGVVILLHGLMGALSNFGGLVDYFANSHNVVFPFLPIFDMPLRKLSV